MNDSPILLDAGPLIAYLSAADADHAWAVNVVASLAPPFLTNEPVLTEDCFVLARAHRSVQPIFDMLSNGSLVVASNLQFEHPAIAALIKKYASLPLSLADACLVRLAELSEGASVLTLDHHFRIYRMHGRRAIPLIIPEAAR